MNTKGTKEDAQGEVQSAIVDNQDIPESRQAMEALRESEARFKALHNASFGGIAIHDKGKILECNQGLSEITGYSNDELMSMDGLLLISEKTRDRVMGNILSGYEKVYESIGLRKNGEEYPIRLEARNIPYKGKNVRVVEFRDITESKRAETALRENEEKYRLIAENISDVISILDMNLRFTYVSPSILRLDGFTPEETLNRSLEDIMPPEYLKKITNDFEEEIMLEVSGTAAPGRTRTFQFEQYRRDSSLMWVEAICSFIRDAEQKPVGLLVVSRDITERKRAEQKLRKSEERYRNIFENVHDVYYETSLDGELLEISPSIEALSRGQYRQADLIGRQVLNFYADAGERGRLITELLESGSVSDFEIMFRNREGSPLPCSVSAKLWRDTHGNPVKIIGSIRDITDRKNAEEEREKLRSQLQQAQKMESVGRLAGGVAHDLNNTLSVISGYTELAIDKVEPDDPLYADLSEVFKAAKRSTGIVQQLLAFARKQVITPVVLDLNDAVSGMIKMLRRLIGEDITFAWHPGADLWPVIMDPSQMDQLLANLCVNARDAISDVGTLTIETQNSDIDEDYCANHAYFLPGKYVLLTVSDTGCGMDPETIDKIFDPFFTTKEVGKGTGLGLSTVYGIVKQNKGFINVYSEPGQGTSFAIYLPRHEDKTAQMQVEVTEGSSSRGHETILLVEDESAILKMIAKMLETLGYHVLAANSPGDALQLARECKGGIHLLMTDVIMPEMNGRDLARNILSLYPDMRRLFMSGFTADIIARHGVLDAGVHFIHKPFSVKDLAAKVRAVLNNDE